MGQQHALVGAPTSGHSGVDQLVSSKLRQASTLLAAAKVDAWLVISPDDGNDPALPFVVGGTPASQRGFFLITARGECYAAVGTHDVSEIERTGGYAQVIPYVGDQTSAVIELLQHAQIGNGKIALNQDAHDFVWGGLSHGRYIWLQGLLGQIGFKGNLVSARDILRPVRSVKSPEELERLTKACEINQRTLDQIEASLTIGLSELAIRDSFLEGARALGAEAAWAVVGFGGPGYTTHREPSSRTAQPGDQLMIDCGVWFQGYASDMSRTFYFLNAGENQLPAHLRHLSNTHLAARDKALAIMRPGVLGWQVDEVARQTVREAGYPEYEHALGHQLGRLVHDGGTQLAPKWELYGQMPYGALMEGEVYTVEPTIITPEGFVCQIEEEFLIKKGQPEVLIRRQTEMICIGV